MPLNRGIFTFYLQSILPMRCEPLYVERQNVLCILTVKFISCFGFLYIYFYLQNYGNMKANCFLKVLLNDAKYTNKPCHY